MGIANQMKRQSFIADMEYKFCLGLSYKEYPLGEKSHYFSCICEYMQEFIDRFDVVSDVRPYLKTFGITESHALRGFVRENLDQYEKKYDVKGDDAPSLMLLRWRTVYFKLNKLMGTYTHLEKKDKLSLVNTIMQTYLWAQNKQADLTDVDKENLDDLIIVAAELLYEIKVYEWSVLNPVNFILICIVEYAIKLSPNNNSLRIQLLKAYDKLGLTSKFTGVSSNVKGLEDDEFVKFGALKYSHYQEYGVSKELDLTCQRYEKYFSEAQAKNKSDLVNGFKNKEFEGLNEII